MKDKRNFFIYRVINVANLGSTANIQPPVVQTPISEPDVTPKPKPNRLEYFVLKPNSKPSIPFPSRVNKQTLQEKSNDEMLKFLQIFRSLHFDMSFADALNHIPKLAASFKNLLKNKEELFNLAKVPLNENCSAVLLKKIPKKLGDPGKFFIPCDFPEMVECLALADLGASINLMPLSVWKMLKLPELTPTRMILELANRTTTIPQGVAEDVCVQVGKFKFPADFVVVDYEVDPRVPLILGRPFLRTTHAIIDVYDEELILRDGDEKLIFYAENLSKNPHKHGKESINMINVIDILCEDNLDEVLKFTKSSFSTSGSTTSSDSSPSLELSVTSDCFLEEFADEFALIDPIPPGIDDTDFDHVIESFSTSPIPVEDSDFLLEETDTLFSDLDYSLPKFETFSFET
ncbi:reverse transcriptase domain-containing protein [Tanacetum coccineum]